MRIDRHVYGSVSGYQTLAKSDGISSAEAKALEGLSIGQSSDSLFHQSLAGSPAYLIHNLGPRRAVTRVSPGPPDDQGRPTIRKVTLVLSRSDWDNSLRGDISLLVSRSDLWSWNGQSALPVLDVPANGAPPPVNARSVQKYLAILSLLENSIDTGRPVVMREGELTLEDLRLLEMVIPPAARGRYTAIYRGLTNQLPASLICLAREAPLPSRVESYRSGQAVELSRYARALSDAGFNAGRLPLDFIQSYRSFGMRSQQPASVPGVGSQPANVRMPLQVIEERTPLTVLVMFVAACILLPICSGFVTYKLTSKRYHEQIAGYYDTLTNVTTLPVFAATQRKAYLAVCDKMLNDSGSTPERSNKADAIRKTSDQIGQFEEEYKGIDQQKEPIGWIKEQLAKRSLADNETLKRLVELAEKVQNRQMPVQAAPPDHESSNNCGSAMIQEVNGAIQKLASDDIPGISTVTEVIKEIIASCNKMAECSKSDSRINMPLSLEKWTAKQKEVTELARSVADATDTARIGDMNNAANSWPDIHPVVGVVVKLNTKVHELQKQMENNQSAGTVNDVRQQVIDRLLQYQRRIEATQDSLPDLCKAWFSPMSSPVFFASDQGLEKMIIDACMSNTKNRYGPIIKYINENVDREIQERIRRHLLNDRSQPLKAIKDALETLKNNPPGGEEKIKLLASELSKWKLSEKANDSACVLKSPADLDETKQMLNDLGVRKVKLKSRE